LLGEGRMEGAYLPLIIILSGFKYKKEKKTLFGA
jgi:hypothetical protein